jgi:hypothetical protein
MWTKVIVLLICIIAAINTINAQNEDGLVKVINQLMPDLPVRFDTVI